MPVTAPATRSDRPAMPPTEGLLKIIGQALLDTMDASVLSDVVVEATPEFADTIWKAWDARADDAQKRRELEALARTDDVALDDAIEAVERALGTNPKSDIGHCLGVYMRLLPGTVRQFCRRPSNPAGTELPAGLPLHGSWDLLPLLPPRLPQFQPGDRPWGVGDWELSELVELGPHGEVWKAVNPRSQEIAPAALHFFTDKAARKYFRGPGADLLDRVLLHGAKLPGVVPLRHVHVHADPPCVEYAYLEAADLTAQVQAWRESQTQADPRAVADLVRQLASIVGRLHDLTPPLVHRNLRPANVLLVPSATGGWECRLANLGLGPWNGPARDKAVVNPYASPEQLQDDAPQPRDDVYALGVLWYQLLVGDLQKGRPGGAFWRRKLAERGMAAGLIELLEACFDDELSARPADGTALARAIEERLRAGIPVAVPVHVAPPRELTNAIGMKLVRLPAGTFTMGSPPTETGRRDSEGPPHPVTLSKAFYLGVHPVTQRQYEQMMGTNPAHFGPARSGGPDHPVESVSWADAVAFCAKLSALPAEKAAGRTYRLPTEAEWEYACRAGTATPFAFGDTLTPQHATFDAGPGSPQGTTPVGRYPPNAWGLCDLHGNVWEWCADWLDPGYYAQSPAADPTGPARGRFRVLRGGSWKNRAPTCRSAARHGLIPSSRDPYTGFRVVLEMVTTTT